MKLDNFLPMDVEKAKAHHDCYIECMDLADVHIAHGNYEMAKHRLTDALNSAHELSKLKDKKNRLDRHNLIVKQMQQAGVNVQIVRSMYGE